MCTPTTAFTCAPCSVATLTRRSPIFARSSSLPPKSRNPNPKPTTPSAATDELLQDGKAAAQILVGLLDRLGRFDEAIAVAAEHLAGVPDGALACPSIAQLCQRAGHPARLAQIARDQGDLVHYAAALLQL